MIQNVIFLDFFFFNIIFGVQLFYIRPDIPTDIIIRFSSRKSQSQQKLAKKITNFTIQVRSKNITHFTNLDSLNIANNMLPQYSQKIFLTLKTFQPTCFCFVSGKTFALQYFLTPKNCIFEVL